MKVRARSASLFPFGELVAPQAPQASLGLLALVALLALVTTSGACAHAQPSAVIAPTPLDMPTPPPRIIQNADAEVPQPVSAPVGAPSGIDELNRAAPSRQPARPAPVRTDPAKPVEPPKVDAAAAPAEPPKALDEPRAQAPSPLQATPPQRESEVEAGIRVVIQRAQTDLNRVDYRGLSADARTQYDSAKGYITLAQDALRARNLQYARTVADKAASIAAQLAGKR